MAQDDGLVKRLRGDMPKGSEWGDYVDLMFEAASRIEALEEALKHWRCDRCAGLGSVTIPGSGDVTPDRKSCPTCDGTGMHPTARTLLNHKD